MAITIQSTPLNIHSYKLAKNFPAIGAHELLPEHAYDRVILPICSRRDVFHACLVDS